MVVGVLMNMHSRAIWCSMTLYATTTPTRCIGQDSTSYLRVLAPRCVEGWKKDKRGGSEG